MSTLTGKGHFFLFSYSPTLRSLVSWSANAQQVLGVRDTAIARDGNLFLRHVHHDDRFQVLTELERALAEGTEYRVTYRWLRPDNNELRWLHCRAGLTAPPSHARTIESPPLASASRASLLQALRPTRGRRRARTSAPPPICSVGATHRIWTTDAQVSPLAQAASSPLFEGVIIDLSEEFTGTVGTLAGPDSLATVLSAFPLLVFTLDRDLRLLRMNRAHDAVLTGMGKSDVGRFDFGDPGFRHDAFRMGRPILSCFETPGHRENFQSLLQRILDGSLPRHFMRIFKSDQVQSLELLPLLEGGVISGVLGIVSDLSEVVRLERELGELQKAEGLRLLAAGVAHHVNNSLQCIIGHASVISAHPENRDIVSQSSQAIIEAVRKTSELSRQLFVFEDPEAAAPQPVDVNLAVMTAVNSIDDLFRSGLKVSVVFGSTREVLGRHSQLVEAMQAILRNAWEALGGKKGSLSVSTHEVTLKEREVSDLAQGAYTRVTITDTGCGMNAETLRRCFEPFFTTKERDTRSGLGLKNAGLGLTKAYAVVRGFNGGLAIESVPEKGSAISLYLPVWEALSQGQNILERKALHGTEALASGPIEAIIFDDDPMVRDTTAHMLCNLGLHCRGVSDSAELMNLLREQRGSVRAVLVDALLPGCDSPALVREIRAQYPAIAVMGFSGASAESTRRLTEAGAQHLVRKPVDPRTLLGLIRGISQSKQAA